MLFKVILYYKRVLEHYHYQEANEPSYITNPPMTLFLLGSLANYTNYFKNLQSDSNTSQKPRNESSKFKQQLEVSTSIPPI